MKSLITTSLIAGLIIFPVGLPEDWHCVNKIEAAQEWVLLGQRTVRDRVDHDTIVVTVARGEFRRLKFFVEGHAIRMYRMVVHYGNGGRQEIETRFLIPAGGESRVIDLRGGDRVIKRIDFWYEAKSVGREGAFLKIYGAR